MDWFKRLFQKPEAPETARASSPLINDAVRQRFARLYRPALHLRPAEKPGFSRLGGLPAMPADAPWPEWKGKPLAFLAQIDLAELHPVMPSFLPPGGRLFFFYDQEQGAWGFDPEDLGAWRVLYFPSSPTGSPRRAPAGLDPSFVFKPLPVKPQRIDLLPSLERLSLTEHDWRADDDVYFVLRNGAFRGLTHHQMLGFPTPVQDDEMELECQLASHGIDVGTPEGYEDPRAAPLRAGAADWRLLLQLDSDDELGWMWGDVGTLYFWIRKQDARAGDFSKVWMVFQCS
jgi:uncharacterized protein YwqG